MNIGFILRASVADSKFARRLFLWERLKGGAVKWVPCPRLRGQEKLGRGKNEFLEEP
jgi:hypothetical protein